MDWCNRRRILAPRRSKLPLAPRSRPRGWLCHCGWDRTIFSILDDSAGTIVHSMAESEFPHEMLLSFLWAFVSITCQFLIGAIVGASIGKDRPSGRRGMVIAMALGVIVFIYAAVVGTLATPQIVHGQRPI